MVCWFIPFGFYFVSKKDIWVFWITNKIFYSFFYFIFCLFISFFYIVSFFSKTPSVYLLYHPSALSSPFWSPIAIQAVLGIPLDTFAFVILSILSFINEFDNICDTIINSITNIFIYFLSSNRLHSNINIIPIKLIA